MAIWTNWDPLLEVIVGDCNPDPHIPNKDWDEEAQTIYREILKETKEDLDALAKKLESLGVKVYRPKTGSKDVDFGDFDADFHPTEPVVPRDQYFVYGNTIYQTYTSIKDRYYDSWNYYDIFKEKFEEGYNWLSMPPNPLGEAEQIQRVRTDARRVRTRVRTDKWWSEGYDIYKNQLAHRLLWHTATMFKCGNILVTNVEGPGTQLGLDWMILNKPAGTGIIPNAWYSAENWGHIDHDFFMTADNKLFYTEHKYIPALLDKQLKADEMFKISKYVKEFDIDAYGRDYAYCGNYVSSAWLKRWKEKWVGTAIDTNVLVVDSKNIIFSREIPELFEYMQKEHSITCHSVPQRHGVFWEAGIHCLTLDIKRLGENRVIISGLNHPTT